MVVREINEKKCELVPQLKMVEHVLSAWFVKSVRKEIAANKLLVV